MSETAPVLIVREDPQDFEKILYTSSEEHCFVARVYEGPDRDKWTALIVEAVNSHASLKAEVERLRAAILAMASVVVTQADFDKAVIAANGEISQYCSHVEETEIMLCVAAALRSLGLDVQADTTP